jgi:hypothetical protein
MIVNIDVDANVNVPIETDMATYKVERKVVHIGERMGPILG